MNQLAIQTIHSLFNVQTLQVTHDALEVDAVLIVRVAFLQIAAAVVESAVARVVSATSRMVAHSRLFHVLRPFVRRPVAAVVVVLHVIRVVAADCEEGGRRKRKKG